MEHRYINPYLVKDLENKLDVCSLFSWIDEEGERLALLGLTNGGYVEFTDAIKRERNIADILPGRVLNEDACILPEKNQRYVIYYKNKLPIHRRRFAVAHEIAHTYWFAPGGLCQPLSSIQRNATIDPNIEYLCDRFAGALLLPRMHLLQVLRHCGYRDRLEVPPLHLIQSLSRMYNVADQAVARRLFFELFPTRVAVVCVKVTQPTPDLFGEDRQLTTPYQMSWCAFPAELQQKGLIPGFRIPLKTSGRLIPQDMIPSTLDSHTQKRTLDGRWWKGIQAQPVEKKARTRLGDRVEQDSREGYVSRRDDLIYLALPL